MLDLNGQRRQDGHTRTMIFGVAQGFSYVNRLMTPYPADLSSNGMPLGWAWEPSPRPCS